VCAAGCVGGVALLAVAALVFYWCRRRSLRRVAVEQDTKGQVQVQMAPAATVFVPGGNTYA